MPCSAWASPGLCADGPPGSPPLPPRGRLAAGPIASIPGTPRGIMLAGTSPLVIASHNVAVSALAPLALFGAAAGLVALCLSGRWKPGGPGGPPGSPPPETAGLVRSGSGTVAGQVGAADRARAAPPPDTPRRRRPPPPPGP